MQREQFAEGALAEQFDLQNLAPQQVMEVPQMHVWRNINCAVEGRRLICAISMITMNLGHVPTGAEPADRRRVH
jgi:hypothetical protein